MVEFNIEVGSLKEFPERKPWPADPMIPSKKYRKLLMPKHYLLIYAIRVLMCLWMRWLIAGRILLGCCKLMPDGQFAHSEREKAH